MGFFEVLELGVSLSVPSGMQGCPTPWNQGGAGGSFWIPPALDPRQTLRGREASPDPVRPPGPLPWRPPSSTALPVWCHRLGDSPPWPCWGGLLRTFRCHFCPRAGFGGVPPSPPTAQPLTGGKVGLGDPRSRSPSLGHSQHHSRAGSGRARTAGTGTGTGTGWARPPSGAAPGAVPALTLPFLSPLCLPRVPCAPPAVCACVSACPSVRPSVLSSRGRPLPVQ